jgi:phenylacetic acid degradation operon negative regulatory protein
MVAISARRLSSFRQSVTDAPVSYSIYSAFSFYSPRHRYELPGAWLVTALGNLGHGAAAIRQSLYRMEGSAELTSRSEGRNKFYRLSPAARAESEAGLSKILSPESGPWDGEWTITYLHAGPERATARERLRELLNTEGFALIGPGLFIHPRDRVARVTRAAQGHDASDIIEVFRGNRIATDHRAFAAAHWDIDGLSARYGVFVDRFGGVESSVSSIDDEAAFVLRFAVVFAYLEVAWRDPELPLDLLPRAWAGTKARSLAARLYNALLPGAIAYADAVMSGLRR